MNILKKYQVLLYVSVICCIVSGVSLLAIPLVDLDGTEAQRLFAVLFAALFWLGLIVEIVLFVIADKKRCIVEKSREMQGYRKNKKALPGVLSYFSNREAVIADMMALISFIAVILMILLKVTNVWVFVIIAAIFFLSFNFHCFFNGRNYKVLKRIQKYNKRQGAKKDE